MDHLNVRSVVGRQSIGCIIAAEQRKGRIKTDNDGKLAAGHMLTGNASNMGTEAVADNEEFGQRQRVFGDELVDEYGQCGADLVII